MKRPHQVLLVLTAAGLLIVSLPAAPEPLAKAAPPTAPAATKNLLAPTPDVKAWQFEQADDATGTIKAEAGALALAATKVDGTDWHVQAFQAGLDLKEGGEYIVTFTARASTKRAAQIYVGVNADDFHQIGLDEVFSLEPAWRDFTFTFKADSVAAKNNRLGFLVGQEIGTVWIKDLTLSAK